MDTKPDFWEDEWMGDTSLAQQYPSLYNIASNKNSTVEAVFETIPINLPFRIHLLGNVRESWFHLVERLMCVHLANQQDCFRWRLT